VRRRNTGRATFVSASGGPPSDPPAMVRPMAEYDEQAHITRIVERLRKDHPDPKMREQLYDKGALPDYVRTLMNGVDDDGLIDRITAAVRDAEDGQPAE
jgi:hypothetical protein